MKKRILSSILALAMVFTVLASVGSITASAAIAEGVTWKEALKLDFEDSSYATYYEATSGNCYISNHENKVNDPGTGDVYRVAAGSTGYTSLNLLEEASPIYNGDNTKVRFELNLAKDNTSEDFHIRLVGSVDGETVTTATDTSNRFIFTSSSKFYFDNDDYRWDGPKYSAKVWYKFTIDVDCESNTYDVYVDDVLVCDGNALAYDFDKVYGISFTARKKSSTNRVYFDNLRYYTVMPEDQVKTSSVTLNTNGGTINSGNITEYVEGSGATLPSNVTREGYTFLGWYESADFSGNAVTEISAEATGNKTYYANWELKPYVITYVTNGGTINDEPIEEYYAGDAFNLPADVEKAYHTFAGWYESADFSGSAVTAISAEATGDKTFYAKWTALPSQQE